ncbi:MAG: hypothetical protein RBU37_26385 [Myxococcota bacterium]|jgi:hypothetical protein|nr:hypothetical protein [Myxococcota bacterium]
MTIITLLGFCVVSLHGLLVPKVIEAPSAPAAKLSFALPDDGKRCFDGRSSAPIHCAGAQVVIPRGEAIFYAGKLLVFDTSGKHTATLSSAHFVEGSDPPAYLQLEEGELRAKAFADNSLLWSRPSEKKWLSKWAVGTKSRWLYEETDDPRSAHYMALGDSPMGVFVDAGSGEELGRRGYQFEYEVLFDDRWYQGGGAIYKLTLENGLQYEEIEAEAIGDSWRARSDQYEEGYPYEPTGSALLGDAALLVAYSGTGDVVAVDPAKDKLLWRWSPGKGRMAVSLLLTEEKVWVMTATEWVWLKGGPTEMRLYALERSTGKGTEISFGQKVYGYWDEQGTEPWMQLSYAPRSRLVIAHLGDHILRVVNADSLAFEWEYASWFWNFCVLDSAAEGDTLALAKAKEVELLHLEDFPKQLPVQKVSVSGTIQSDEVDKGIPVMVAGRMTHTDKKGHYRLELETRGDELLLFAGGRDCSRKGKTLSKWSSAPTAEWLTVAPSDGEPVELVQDAFLPSPEPCIKDYKD